MRRFIGPALSVALAAAPFVASARFPTESALIHASADVERVMYDARGREVKRTIERFDADSRPAGRTVIQRTYRMDRLERVEFSRYSADGTLMGRGITDYEAARPAEKGQPQLPPRSERRELDATGQLLEIEIVEHEPDPAGVLTTGTRRDAAGEVLEIRYTLTRRFECAAKPSAAGQGAARLDAGTELVGAATKQECRGASGEQWTAADTSVYAANGEQRARSLVEWRGLHVHRYSFDVDDEIVEHEHERRVVDARGRVLSVSSDTVDGRGQARGAREERFVHAGPSGALSDHVITWYDAAGTAQRRRTSVTLFTGGRPSGARVSHETWAPPVDEGSVR